LKNLVNEGLQKVTYNLISNKATRAFSLTLFIIIQCSGITMPQVYTNMGHDSFDTKPFMYDKCLCVYALNGFF
jgi:hypothetical protein